MQHPQFVMAGAACLLFATAASADPLPPAVAVQAEALAASLAAACPLAPYNDEAAFQACTKALRTVRIPFLPDIAWGGDQPDRQIKKRTLTHFNSQTFRVMYLPLFVFTGHWSLAEDNRSHSPILRLEAYFRNALPSGDFPYPFWHSADKWKAYETANELRLYLNPKREVFIVTRDAAGSDERRGSYAHVNTPAFTDNWQWRDATGALQPHASLFESRYAQANPHLPALDDAYRVFALKIRDQSCLNCHTPANKAEADRLVLLQTPMHAAGEIGNVIAAVEAGEMPQNDIGLRRDIPAADRAALLKAAVAFQSALRLADKWEAHQIR